MTVCREESESGGHFFDTTVLQGKREDQRVDILARSLGDVCEEIMERKPLLLMLGLHKSVDMPTLKLLLNTVKQPLRAAISTAAPA